MRAPRHLRLFYHSRPTRSGQFGSQLFSIVLDESLSHDFWCVFNEFLGLNMQVSIVPPRAWTTKQSRELTSFKPNDVAALTSLMSAIFFDESNLLTVKTSRLRNKKICKDQND